MKAALMQQARVYDQTYPAIWREFEKRALQLIHRGVSHYGAKAIMEVIRFDTAIGANALFDFKINNNYTAYFALKFKQAHPEHENFFETRRSSDGV